MLASKELSSVLALGGRTHWRLGCYFVKLSSSLRSLPLPFSADPPSHASGMGVTEGSRDTQFLGP